ncbi:MAG: hypothetical protein EBU68_07070 [Actinobacteria bacterium]|nr:hypothetical protein [Actinomycetota bacterium]
MINAIDKICGAKNPLLILSFEDTVLRPQEAIDQIEKFLNRSSTRRTKKVLRRQSLPRTQISAGKATSNFSFTSNGATSEAQTYKAISAEISASGSKNAIAEFKAAISTYNSRWPSQLTALEKIWV